MPVYHAGELDVAVVVDRRAAGHLGGAVNLLQVDPQGVEKAHGVRAEGSPGRVSRADAGQAKLVADGAEDQVLAQPVGEVQR